MGIEAAPRTVEQTRNGAPGEVTHVGTARGRADSNRGNTIAACSVAYECTQLIGGATHWFRCESLPDEDRKVRVVSRLGARPTFGRENGANAIDGERRWKCHEAAGAGLDRQGKTRCIGVHAMNDELKWTWELGPGRLARIIKPVKRIAQVLEHVRQQLRRVRSQMGDAGGGRPPRQIQPELQVSGVLIDGAIGTRSVENDSGIGDLSGFEACEGAIAGDLVLQHELEYQIAIELQLPLDDDTHETKTDGDGRLVVHGSAAVNRIGLRIGLSGIGRVRPLSRIALRANVKVTHEDQRAATPFSRQANDDVVAAGDRADRLDGVGVKAQRGSVHRHQDRREADRGHMLAHPMHNGVLGFEAARDADQFLQQGGPVVLAIDDHAMRSVERTAIARVGLEVGWNWDGGPKGHYSCCSEADAGDCH